MKNNKGITLVALVITIIILLILAGITISQLTGSGLFENAKRAEEKTKNAQEKEESILAEYANEIDKNTNKQVKTEVNSIEDILEVCNINKNYTKEQIINNEDNILDKILENKISTDYLLENNLEDMCNSEKAMTSLGKSEYAGYEVIMNDQYFDKVMNSTYVDNFDAGSITTPTMTADEMDGKSAYSTWTSAEWQHTYLGFDKDKSTLLYISALGDGAAAFDFGEDVIAYKIKITPGGESGSYNKSGIIGYTDIEKSLDLTNVLQYTNTKVNDENIYTLTTKSAHRIWGVKNLTRWDGQVKGEPYAIGISEIEIYCRKPAK